MAVVGIAERNGMATAKVFEKAALGLKGLTAFCKAHVDTGSSIVMTDEYSGYNGLNPITEHAVVDHKVTYAIGDTHINTIEGFWSLIKRAWYGQHHHYSKQWANYYISETAFKYNNRKNIFTFENLIQHMVGVNA